MDADTSLHTPIHVNVTVHSRFEVRPVGRSTRTRPTPASPPQACAFVTTAVRSQLSHERTLITNLPAGAGPKRNFLLRTEHAHMSSELLTAFARGVTRLLPWAHRQFRRSQNGNNLLDKARNSGNNTSQTDSETSQNGDVFGGVSTINTPLQKHPSAQGFLFSQNVGPYIRPTAFSETMISKTAAAEHRERTTTTARASGEARTK